MRTNLEEKWLRQQIKLLRTHVQASKELYALQRHDCQLLTKQHRLEQAHLASTSPNTAKQAELVARYGEQVKQTLNDYTLKRKSLLTHQREESNELLRQIDLERAGRSKLPAVK